MLEQEDWVEGRTVPVPRSIGTLGLVLFLSSLFMLFAAAIIGYLMIRLVNPKHPPLHTLKLPDLLWVSTALVICVSFALHRAVASVRREKQRAFRFWMAAGLILGASFVAVQIPALTELLVKHHQSLRQYHGEIGKVNIGMYGLIFCLVLLHAAHVVGGIGWLVPIGVFSCRGRYDHEHYLPVRHVAIYWHFIDAVWIVMFLTFWLTQ